MTLSVGDKIELPSGKIVELTETGFVNSENPTNVEGKLTIIEED